MTKITFLRAIALCAALCAALSVLLGSTSLLAQTSGGPDGPQAENEFSNTTPIDIPDVGAASVYPSTITVSGMNGSITSVQVLLMDVAHTYPNDMDILLVGPTGARSIIMSDMGDGFGGVSGATLLFDSVNGEPLPTQDGGVVPISSGTYLPQNAGNFDDIFPAPGPGTLPLAEPADLGAFNGTDPNGDWQLYVVDDTVGDAGEISDGWKLIIRDDSFFMVTKTADTNDGVCDTDCSLREAITAADDNGRAYDEIRFAPDVFSTPRTIELTSSLPGIRTDLEISGPGADLLTVRRSSGGNYRIFEFKGSGPAIVRGMTISNGNAGSGGGIYATTELHLDGVHFENNQAARGGGVFLSSGAVSGVVSTIVNSTFAANTATERGGGVYFQGRFNEELQLLNTTVSGNHAPWGSGIGIEPFDIGFEDISSLFVKSSTIANNTGGGDGIRSASNTLDIKVDLTLQNTILANNSGANINVINTGSGNAEVISQGHNMSSDNSGGWLAQSSDMVDTDPLLGVLQYNGGPTPTHALPLGSPALNAGSSNGNGVDQRGQPRPYYMPVETSAEGGAGNFGDFSDMGAVEMQYLQVTNADDSGAGSLRQAMLDANGNGAGLDDILFAPGYFRIPRTINLASVLPVISSNMNIVGTSAERLTVRRDSGGDYRVLTTAFSDIDVSLSGFTVSNGNATNAGGGGGGIRADSRLTLTDMAISGNVSSISSGGLKLTKSTRLIRTTISENVSGSNAAGLDLQPFVSDVKLTISNSTISGNHGRESAAGGLNVSAFGGKHAYVEISGSTIAGNDSESQLQADGISVIASDEGTHIDVIIQNTLFSDNGVRNIFAIGDGGGTVNVSSAGFNLSDDDGSGFLTGSGDQINTPAKLAPLAHYGGPTKTHALMADSPAIDQGLSENLRHDHRGFPGPFDFPGIASADGGNGADIGAVEMQAIVVTNADDSGAGSLRQALLDANANGLGHDDIVFAMPFFGGMQSIDLTSALPMVQSSLAIVGTGARKLVIRRDSGSLEGFQMLQVMNGERVSLSGVSISDGRAIETGGAGIVSNIPFFLSRTAVSDNQCEFCSSALSLKSDGYLEDCTISGNSAIYDGATITFAPTGGGSMRINNCTISGNDAPYALIDISSKASDVSGEDILVGLSDTTIVNNDDGLGIYNVGGGDISVSVQNSVVINNTSLNFWADALGSGAAGFVSWGHNIVGDDSSGVFIQPGDQVIADALLGPLAANGGPTETHFPQAGSPVLDAGKCLDGLVHHDQRGFIRPFDFPAIAATSDGCDVGAVEWSDSNGDGFDDGLVLFSNGFE